MYRILFLALLCGCASTTNDSGRNLTEQAEDRQALAPTIERAAPLGELRRENARLHGKVKLLEERVRELEDTERQLFAVLRPLLGEHPRAEITPLPWPDIPAIATTVTAIHASGATLGAGLSSGVEIGFSFTVYRDSKFIGKVVVEECFPERSVARLLFVAPGQSLERGDNAATRLD